MRSIFFILITFMFFTKPYAQPIPVELIQNKDGWQLFRDGEVFKIKGAGGENGWDLLVKSGGNATRTWGVGENLMEQLDKAHELGLTVILGHWLGHERHGFDYNNDDLVKEQYERVKRDVLKYKDHPAVLMWGIGNEMEGFGAGDNPKIWQHVQDIALMIKNIDPHHPTMTVTAEIGGDRIKSINTIASAIDIHGINSYGGLPSLLDRYKSQGGIKPVIVTEFGPPGTWEVGSNSFGAPIELTSTQKAEVYKKAYTSGCLDQSDLCLGGFAFIWGYKMEATATWFGMFLPTGEKLAAVDAMTEIWSGKQPKNLSPKIDHFELEGPEVVFQGDEMIINLKVSDPNNDPLTIEWKVLAEASEYFTGGDAQNIPIELDGIIMNSSIEGSTLIAPEPGMYRVYVTVKDGKGSAAVANAPFKVKEDENRTTNRTQSKIKLPLKVYADGAPQLWTPSGWMGNSEKLEMNWEFGEITHTGETSIKVNYKAFDNWVGVTWQNPINDWGDLPGGYNLTGAKKLTFWAKGEKGGEKISFGVGILKSDRKYFDTAFAELKDVTLTNNWKQYSIDLRGKDLSVIKTPFYWTFGSAGFPITFYLDDIQFE